MRRDVEGVDRGRLTEKPEVATLRGEEVEAPYGKLSPGPGRPADQVAEHQRRRIQGAMIQIVAERGYGALRVRDLVHLAGVSSRTFYENFESKEDCFLRTYELVMRRASRRIIAAQAGERHWRERPLLVFNALARELEGESATARFALIKAYEAGPVPLEHVRLAEKMFEAMLGETFARAPGGIVVTPLIIEAMIGGAVGVARARLRAGRQGELRGLGDEIVKWALSYPGPSSDLLAGLDGQSVWRNTRFTPPDGERRGMWPSKGDRSVLLSSVAELAVANSYRKLTVTRIHVNAQVSRKVFDANFESVEDCFLMALKQKAEEVLAQIARAQTAGRSWPGGVYRGIAALCEQVAGDPFLALACLADPFAEPFAGDSLAVLTRRRLVATILEQFSDNVPAKLRQSPLSMEASNGALWALFHRHLVRDWVQRREIAATLAFIALAPIIGDTAAVVAIRREQTS